MCHLKKLSTADNTQERMQDRHREITTAHLEHHYAQVSWKQMRKCHQHSYNCHNDTSLNLACDREFLTTIWPNRNLIAALKHIRLVDLLPFQSRKTTFVPSCLLSCTPLLFWSGPEVIKHFSCSTQLSMKFSLIINMKMPIIVGIFIFISRENFMLSLV